MVQQQHSHYQKQSPSSNDLLVTLDGVTQYPNTQSTTRAYSVLENVLTFTSAPAAGVIIQARHIGFAGASSQSVTGFYGRTGNVSLKNTDDVSVNDITNSCSWWKLRCNRRHNL